MGPGKISMFHLHEFFSKLGHDFTDEISKHIIELFFVCVGSFGGSLYRWGKNWYQRGNTAEKQSALCLEAERLLKIRATLAVATEPMSQLTDAKVVITGKLNQVLEQLSHLLTEPQISRHGGRSMEIVGRYLLLYHSTGILSGIMHWTFYFLAFLWCVFVPFVFKASPDEIAIDIVASLIVLLPVVGWNYLTRRIDNWLRNRHPVAPPVTAASITAK